MKNVAFVSLLLVCLSALSTTFSVPVQEAKHPKVGSTWKWYQLKGTKCADGSETGFGLSTYPNAKETVLYFEGGGACWDADTCYKLNLAYYVTTGFKKELFEQDAIPFLTTNRTITLRNETVANPYRKANYVYIPYCTGDIHGGNSVQIYAGANRTTYHHGFLNGIRITSEIAKRLPETNRVLVTGESAGGYGAVIHYDHVQKRFPHARVDLLSDSAIEEVGFLDTKPQWNLVPPKCEKCDGIEFNSYLPGEAIATPKSRFGALAWKTDIVLPVFFNITPASFQPTITSYFQNVTQTKSNNARTFRADGSNHVVGTHTYANATDGTVYVDWLNKFHSDDPSWSSAL
jgi:Pectinacetylesterase